MSPPRYKRWPVYQIRQVGTPEQMSTVNPLAILTTPPTNGGLPLGVTMTRPQRPFWLDMLQLHQMGLTGGTSGLILGERGSGKTTTMMKMLGQESSMRNGITGRRRRVAIDDTRLNLKSDGTSEPEYRACVEDYLGGDHIDLANRGINPLDHRMGQTIEQQFDTTVSLLEMVVRRSMTEAEQVALSIGLAIVNLETPTYVSPDLVQMTLATQRLGDYVNFQELRRDRALETIGDPQSRERMRQRFAGDWNMLEGDFLRNSNTVSEMILRLTNGFGGVFGAKASLYAMLTNPVVGLNFTRLPEEAVALVEMILWAWRGAALGTSNTEMNLDLVNDMEAHDENVGRWKRLVYAEKMVQHLKLIRSRDPRIWRSLHRISDLKQVGTADSRQRQLAFSALAETDVVMVGRTRRSEHELLQNTFGELHPDYLNMLPTLGKGQFLVIIGESWTPFPVQIILTDDERRVSYTDKARDAQIAGGNGQPISQAS